MKKLFKRLTVVLALALSVTALALFAGCGDKTDSDEGYYVTYLKLADDITETIDFTTIKAQWCTHSGGNCYGTMPNFDANGKARVTIKALENFGGGETEFDAHVLGLPEGYTYAEGSDDYVVSPSRTTVTITIVKK